MTILTPEVALHFRDQLRGARALALRDSEAFDEILFVFERLGAYLDGQIRDLGRYLEGLKGIAVRSPMAIEIPTTLPEHSSFEAKYDVVRRARNEAFHQGALARNLTVNAIELSLVLEEGLMSGTDRVSDFMVKHPVCAYMWQPLSFIRQTMLVNSFSYLPVPVGEGINAVWKLVSDYGLAQYLRSDGQLSRERLMRKLKEAVDKGELRLIEAKSCSPEEKVQDVLQASNGVPSLVLSTGDKQLIGILTSFDML